MKLLKYKKFSGLHIVCKKCNKNIEVSQGPYKGCSHPIDRQKYKAILRQNGSRKTRDLKALEYDEAIRELLDFKHELANPIRLIAEVPKVEVKHELLKDCIMMFGDWLENVDVPNHQKRPRTSGHIKNTLSNLIKFSRFLEDNKFDLNKFKIYDLNDVIIGKYYDYLDLTCRMATTYNHNTKSLKSFNNFLINQKGFNIPNFFGKVKLKYESMNPTSIKDDDFKKLLNAISNEDSICIYPNGRRKNEYRTYTRDAIELVAYTGMRIEETMSLKFSDIVLDDGGNIQHLVGTDLKFERAHNWNNTKAPKKVLIPISAELENVLNRLEYKKYMGTDKYLIADDFNISRKTLATQLSHSFTFFRKKAKLSDDFSIKHLRKTFLTKLHTKTGFIETLGYQRSAKVTINNYIDKVQVVKEINKIGFGYFSE